MKKISLAEKFSLFDDLWCPKIIAELNGQHVKVAKVKGEFEWHQHPEADELFWVIDGLLDIELRQADTVRLGPGELFVVPRGIEHRPVARELVHLVMFETAGTVNTGDKVSHRTVESLDVI